MDRPTLIVKPSKTRQHYLDLHDHYERKLSKVDQKIRILEAERLRLWNLCANMEGHAETLRIAAMRKEGK